MCSLQRNYDVIRNWERFETGPLTVMHKKDNFRINMKEPMKLGFLMAKTLEVP